MIGPQVRGEGRMRVERTVAACALHRRGEEEDGHAGPKKTNSHKPKAIECRPCAPSATHWIAGVPSMTYPSNVFPLRSFEASLPPPPLLQPKGAGVAKRPSNEDRRRGTAVALHANQSAGSGRSPPAAGLGSHLMRPCARSRPTAGPLRLKQSIRGVLVLVLVVNNYPRRARRPGRPRLASALPAGLKRALSQTRTPERPT